MRNAKVLRDALALRPALLSKAAWAFARTLRFARRAACTTSMCSSRRSQPGSALPLRGPGKRCIRFSLGSASGARPRRRVPGLIDRVSWAKMP